MKTKFAMTCVMFGTLPESAVPMAADDSDSDRSSPKTFVNDSAVTTNIKIKLAAQHLTRIVRKLNLAIGDAGSESGPLLFKNCGRN
jgi:hypothetical protein